MYHFYVPKEIEMKGKGLEYNNTEISIKYKYYFAGSLI